MTDRSKILQAAQHPPTAVTQSGLNDDAQQRLATVVLVLTVGLAIALSLNELFAAAGWPPVRNLRLATATQGVLILGSLTFIAFMRLVRLEPTTALNLGLCFEVFGALFLAFPWFYGPIAPHTNLADITYVCVWIMIFPLFLSASPKQILFFSLLAATMPLVSYFCWLFHSRESLAAPHLLVYAFLPNYFCAVLAVIPAALVGGLTRKLAAARRSLEQLGQYRLLRKLGAGGMGEVWEAEHLSLARPAAIKLVRREARANSGSESRAIERFKREARVTAKLSSPHTVQLFDYGVTDTGIFYYVMELLNGIDLELFVETFGPLPANRAIFILEQVCDSLIEAHEEGLVHRDIKPGNIALCQVGASADFVKVLDFGLVSETQASSDPKQALRLTGDDGLLGTPAFVAPEVIEHRELDGRADIYSLACVAVWLLTGRYVFEADSPMAMLIKHLSEEPQPFSSSAPRSIPPEFESLILACLSKQPERRPSSAREFQQRLRGILIEPWTPHQALDWWSLNEASVKAASAISSSAASSPEGIGPSFSTSSETHSV